MASSRPERSTRSRYSSPYPPSNRASAVSSGTDSVATPATVPAKPKTFLDRWVEPPLPTPRPSFADHGIERHGVVAGMAALGTRPSAKVLKSITTRSDMLDLSSKSSLGRRSATSSTPIEATPEPSATAPPCATSESSKEASLPLQSPKTPQQPKHQSRQGDIKQQAEGELLGPGVFAAAQSPKPSATVFTPSRAYHPPLTSRPASEALPDLSPTAATPTTSNLNRPLFPLSAPAPFNPMGTPMSSSFAQTPTIIALPPPPLGDDGEPLIDLEKTDRVIESAVQNAIDANRYPTAYALRMLYDDVRDKDAKIVRLIEAVYGSRASDSQITEFHRLLKPMKREGMTDRTGEYYFNGDGSDPAPLSKYSALNTALTYGVTPTTRPTTSRSVGETQPILSSINMSTSPLKEYDISHIAKKQKQSHVSPYPPLPMNGLLGLSAVNGHSNVQSNTVQANGGSPKPPVSVRSGSVSSSSSLSSVDEQILGADFTSPKMRTRNTGGRALRRASAKGDPMRSTAVNSGNTNDNLNPDNRDNNGNSRYSASPTDTPATGQHNSKATIVNGPPKNGPKIHTFATVAPQSSSTIPSSHLQDTDPNRSKSTDSHTNTASDAEMATRGSDRAATKSAKAAEKAAAAKAARDKKADDKPTGPVGRPHDLNDTANRLKRAAKELTESSIIQESFERSQLSSGPDVETASEPDTVDVAPSKRPAKIPRLSNRTTRGRANEDSEDLSSPTVLSFQPDLAPGSVSASRAGTPSTSTLRPTRRARGTGSGLRVKSSPVKKKGAGTLAGIPRTGGERNSPAVNGGSNNQDENDDYCAACSGNGDLVCCDGCCRSFHFLCVDPPMIAGSLPESWYCNLCQYEQDPNKNRREGPPRGFDLLFDGLEQRNPSSFHLPKDIQERFEGVATGPEGEYEEVTPPVAKSKTQKGVDEAVDGFRLKDAKGKPILCHSCNRAASMPDRAIISCGFCGLHWHMDCLDTPKAKEPAAGRLWKCPAHVDDLLDLLPAKLGPAHRFRKIKGSSAIAPAWKRGIKNNGNIEIENAADPEEDRFVEEHHFGETYLLPEEGIKLDFIAKCKMQGGGIDLQRLLQGPQVRLPPPMDSRSIEDQQAALNIAAFAAGVPNHDKVDGLINELLANVPPAAISLMAQSDAISIPKSRKQNMKLSNQGKIFLETLQVVIQQRLDAEAEEEPELTINPAAQAETGQDGAFANRAAETNHADMDVEEEEEL